MIKMDFWRKNVISTLLVIQLDSVSWQSFMCMLDFAKEYTAISELKQTTEMTV